MLRSGPRCSSGANCSVQLHHDDGEDDNDIDGNDDEDDHDDNDDEENVGDDDNFHKLSNQ